MRHLQTVLLLYQSCSPSVHTFMVLKTYRYQVTYIQAMLRYGDIQLDNDMDVHFFLYITITLHATSTLLTTC
jgi:hypothetical protein